MGPNISTHYISITFASLHFKCNYICHNLSGFTARRASVRFYGIPESTPGSTDDEILALCNTHLKFNPPLRHEEIEVSHRVGKTEGKWDAVTKPRPIVLKFVSRRDKSCMMQSRKKLYNLQI